jgi:hypothetical protein
MTYPNISGNYGNDLVSTRIIILCLVVFSLLSCERKTMGWIQFPVLNEPNKKAVSLLIAEVDNGFLGTTITTEASLMNPDWKKSLAMDSSEILAIGENGLKRRSLLRVPGILREFYSTGHMKWIAINERISSPDMHESTHILHFNGSEWSEISKLELRNLRIWSGCGPILLATGQSLTKADSSVEIISFDGGEHWENLNVPYFNNISGIIRSKFALDEEGQLFSIQNQTLYQSHLEETRQFSKLRSLVDLPLHFKPTSIFIFKHQPIVFGKLLDGKLALMTTDEKGLPQINSCLGIPSQFEIDRAFLGNTSWYVEGTLEIQKNNRTESFSHMIWESKNKGATWFDKGLPIKGSLKSIAVGSDGRIWALAAGNRMQVFIP